MAIAVGEFASRMLSDRQRCRVDILRAVCLARRSHRRDRLLDERLRRDRSIDAVDMLSPDLGAKAGQALRGSPLGLAAVRIHTPTFLLEEENVREHLRMAVEPTTGIEVWRIRAVSGAGLSPRANSVWVGKRPGTLPVFSSTLTLESKKFAVTRSSLVSWFRSATATKSGPPAVATEARCCAVRSRTFCRRGPCTPPHRWCWLETRDQACRRHRHPP